MSTAKQNRQVSWGFPFNLLCFFFPKTQTRTAYPQQDLQHPHSRTSMFLPRPQKARLGWQPLVPQWVQRYRLRAGQLAGGSQRRPAQLLDGATNLSSSAQLQCSQNPLTAPYREFNPRAQWHLQTYATDLNFSIIFLSDLQGRFCLQYFSLSTGTKLCASSSIKSVNAAKICYHFLSLCCPV